MTLTIKNEELLELNESSTPQFPKYTSQLINLANQNAQGTRKFHWLRTSVRTEMRSAAHWLCADIWQPGAVMPQSYIPIWYRRHWPSSGKGLRMGESSNSRQTTTRLSEG
mgnify:CR=1 FL=1